MPLSANPLFRLIKPLLKAVVWPEGSIRTILRGPARGLRYRIFHGYGWSPLYGGWEAEAQAVMVSRVRGNSVVYDIGANYGIHTLLLARLTSTDGGEVHAFEPLPEIMSSLRENVDLNGFSNVTLAQTALSDAPGTVDFVIGPHGGAGHLAEGQASGRTVPVHVTTLDDYVFGSGRRPPAFIKIDVEGAEARVLRGATRVLREAGPAILMDIHGDQVFSSVMEILQDADYSVVDLADRSRIAWPRDHGVDGPRRPDTILAFRNSP